MNLQRASIDRSNTITCRENRTSMNREINLPADKLILLLLLNNTFSYLILLIFGSKKIGLFTIDNVKSLGVFICISYRLQWEFCELSNFVSPDTSECHFASMWIMQPVKKTALVGFSYVVECMHLNSEPACTISCTQEMSLLGLSGCKTSNRRNSLPHYRGETKQFSTLGGNS